MLVENQTAVGESPKIKARYITAVQAYGNVSAGVGTSEIDIEVSNDGVHWLVAFTIVLTLGVTDTTDGQELRARWEYVRGNVRVLTGTNAKVSVVAGEGL